ncbi:MAG: thioesterase, partial [Coriobacteriia bacterium]|nr:thioesterase [Coriobacteriia bacterium]
SGENIGYASSLWAIMDMNSRHGMPLTVIPSLKEHVVDRPNPIGAPKSLPKVDGESALSFTVRYSKIDVNNHANSLYYIQWISDCFSLDFYRSHKVRRFEINYLKELTIDDKGRVYREEVAPGDYFFEIVTRDRGVACKARILFDEL